MQPAKNLMFSKGDLVHVPQAAVLYGSSSPNLKIFIIKKPMLAIFMDYKDDGMSEIVMDGQKWLVKNREIYSNKEAI